MIGTIDYYGLAAVIAAITGLITAIGGVVLGGAIHRTSTDTNAKVTTSNGHTLGEITEQVDKKTDALTSAAGIDPAALTDTPPPSPPAP